MTASPTAVPRRSGALRRAERITSLSVVGRASTLGAPAKVTSPTWNRAGISSRKASAAVRAASMRVGGTSVLSIDWEVSMTSMIVAWSRGTWAVASGLARASRSTVAASR
jgi:hypothetical protein